MSEEFVGQVIREPFAVGSKSERVAVKLVTDAGAFVLKRPTGNPFSDPVLEKLVGHRVRCLGRVSGTRLVLEDWEVLDKK